MPLFPDEPLSKSSIVAKERAVPEEEVLSVAALDHRLRRAVEGATDGLSVAGEVAGLREVASGHIYFTLKDEHDDAAIGCVMYRTAPVRARRLLADGARVVITGRATIYAPRGQLQLVAEGARPLGRGALLEALERLKKKLHDEGLFARERKRKLPADPRVIGVVTSVDGAALHDIVKVAFRRARIRVVLARATVQGPDAPQKLARALAMLARHPEVEAIILGRGGGSVDDLAAFNDEALVRAVAACPVPVVSAVGHEIDSTLVDLVADARAATPSQAAELLVADWASTIAHMRQLEGRLGRAMSRALDERVAHLDDKLARLTSRATRIVTRRAQLAADLERRLSRRHPTAVLAQARAALGPLGARLSAALTRDVAVRRRRLADRAARLDAMSPLAVLSRGYAIATRANGAALRVADDASVGETIDLRLSRGRLTASVVSIDAGDVEPNRERGPR